MPQSLFLCMKSWYYIHYNSSRSSLKQIVLFWLWSKINYCTYVNKRPVFISKDAVRKWNSIIVSSWSAGYIMLWFLAKEINAPITYVLRIYPYVCTCIRGWGFCFHIHMIRTVPFIVWSLCDSKGFLIPHSPSPSPPLSCNQKFLSLCSKMLKFWTLSATAAFCLGEVLSVNPGDFMIGQFGRLPSWGGAGGLNIHNHGGDGGSRQLSSPNMPQIQIGDDKIRIACITFNLPTVTFSFGHFHRSV